MPDQSLSPAAMAVYDAFIKSPMVLNHMQDDRNAIAAALRALAENVVPIPLCPHDSCCDVHRAFINTRIHDIASELENTDA